MTSIQALNLFDEDRNMIFATLAKNDKVEIFQSLTIEQQNSLEHFATYMRSTDGLSDATRRSANSL